MQPTSRSFLKRRAPASADESPATGEFSASIDDALGINYEILPMPDADADDSVVRELVIPPTSNARAPDTLTSNDAGRNRLSDIDVLIEPQRRDHA